MGILQKVFSSGAGKLIKDVGGVLDDLTTSKEEKLEWMKNVKPIVEYNFRHLINFKIKYQKRIEKRTQELFKTFNYHGQII